MKKIMLVCTLVILLSNSICQAQDYYVGWDKQGTVWYQSETIKFTTGAYLSIDFWAKHVLYYDQGYKLYYIKVLAFKNATPQYKMVITETYDNEGKMVSREQFEGPYQDLIQRTLEYALVNQVAKWIHENKGGTE